MPLTEYGFIKTPRYLKKSANFSRAVHSFEKAEFTPDIFERFLAPGPNRRIVGHEKACRPFPTPLLFSRAKTIGVASAKKINHPIRGSPNLVWCLTDKLRVRICAPCTERNNSICKGHDVFSLCLTQPSSVSLTLSTMACEL